MILNYRDADDDTAGFLKTTTGLKKRGDGKERFFRGFEWGVIHDWTRFIAVVPGFPGVRSLPIES